MTAQAKGKIAKRRHRSIAHCDHRKHLQSLRDRQEAQVTAAERPKQDSEGGSPRQWNIHAQTSGPQQSEPQRGQAGDDLM